MSIGTREREKQEAIWIEAALLATPGGHPFYEKLNGLLDERKFDGFAEETCRRFYLKTSRPGLAPAVYFRLLLVGYSEGIDSERGIAWRAADSLALRSFLGYGLSDATPDHSTISRTRRLIDVETHRTVFGWVLNVLGEEGLLKGNTVAIDGTTLEANAALRSIVRRDTGEAYDDFLKRLAKESGIETPTREQLAKLDRKRPKKGSNDDWKNPHDPDARICGVAAETNNETVGERVNPEGPAELVLDRGYHSNDAMVSIQRSGVRTYCSEPKRGRRNWKGKAEEQAAVYANRRRIRGSRGLRLLRQRGERIERSFAHMYETGAMRRTHLRHHDNIIKRLLIHGCAFNLGLAMRKMTGYGTPRGLHESLNMLLTCFDATGVVDCLPHSQADQNTTRVPMPRVTPLADVTPFHIALLSPAPPTSEFPKTLAPRAAKPKGLAGCWKTTFHVT